MLPGVIMADALAGANRDREALALITRLLDGSSTPETGIFISELWRIRGELLLRQSVDNALQAENFLGIALRIATDQGAPVFQLRAGIPLARLLAEDGRRAEAKIAIDRASAVNLSEWGGPEVAVAAQLRSHLG
jgi:hypothetical protein